MNYCELLFSTGEEHLDNEVLINAENGDRLKYRELIEEVLKIAYYLKSRRYKPGTIIATHIYNSNEAAIVTLAIEYIGCVVGLIDPLFKANELKYYLDDSGAKCLITHLELAEVEQEINTDVDIINVREVERLRREGIKDSDRNLPMYDFKENELALLLYTSGSTSTPKAVMIPAGNFFVFLRKSDLRMYRYIPEDRLLCYVPFSHGYGSVSLLLPALKDKAAIVFLRSFNPIKVANTIAAENITHIFGVPTHYKQLLRYESIYGELRKLKAAFCTASPLSSDTAYAWYKNIGIYLDEGFGLSEATTLIATRISALPEPSGNVGFPPEGILKVEAVDEAGNTLEEGIIGELRVHGPGLMLGYLNRPAETAERIREGWLYTGDLGYRRSDGSIVVCGRKTEFINVAGLKIAPIEIEAVLNSHPTVLDSAAIGVEDSIYGEIVKAFVVLKQGETVSERDLIKYVSGKLANFKIPKFITFIEEMPRNNIGKIDRKALKAL